MPEPHRKVILVAVLDWGLGHAGRMIPLITALKGLGYRIILAANGRAGYLLKDAFPDLPYLECPPYDMHYRSRNMYWNMLLQFPKIGTAIIKEHRWLRYRIREYHIDLVISDSRFGCFHPAIPSVIVAHQLRLLLSPEWLSGLVNFGYRKLLDRFDAIWVPDDPDGLSGRLSYPSPFTKACYIGQLSRMQFMERPQQYDLLVLLSGPEPQRSILEARVLSQLHRLTELSVLIIQGKTGRFESKTPQGSHYTIVSYLSGQQLQGAIASAGVVLCRSGYSSLMDLSCSGKKAILIPTPGQPEQEYLGRRCREKGWAYVVSQAELDLPAALEAVKTTSGMPVPDTSRRSELPERISCLLEEAGCI